MKTTVMLWAVENGSLVQLNNVRFADSHKEAELEAWIEKNPSLLGGSLIIIGRQVHLPKIGYLDLLAVDSSGRLVIIEFKRQQTTRDTIAQILDYASVIARMDFEELRALSNVNTDEVSEINDFDPMLMVVAADADDSVDRIVEYLGSSVGLKIEVVTFTYAKLHDGREIIARSIRTPETQIRSHESKKSALLSDVLKLASDRGILPMVEMLRKVKNLDWPEQITGQNGVDLRYWVATPSSTNGNVIFGMNVAGDKFNCPNGALDLWFWPGVISEYAEIAEDEAWNQLTRFPVLRETKNRIFMRIKTVEEASNILTLLTQWDSRSAEFRAKRAAEDGSE